MIYLICGSRAKKDYRHLVNDWLNLNHKKGDLVIEGCCKNSADEYAEDWIKEMSDGTVEGAYPIKHYPGQQGTYLKRNIEMVRKCDKVIAFWDGYSYGTAHTIAQAVLNGKEVEVIKVEYDKG